MSHGSSIPTARERSTIVARISRRSDETRFSLSGPRSAFGSVWIRSRISPIAGTMSFLVGHTAAATASHLQYG